MSISNDPFDGMDETLWPPRLRDPLQLDDGTVDRLLDGLPPDDAPPSYRGVAELLSTLNAPPSADEFVSEPRALAPRPAVPWRPTTNSYSSWERPTKKTKKKHRLRRSGAALVGTATLFVGLGAAGALPGPAQGVASDVLATVGVNAPNPGAGGSPDTRPASNNAPADGASNSSGDPGKGATVSGTATDDSTTGVDKGAAVSSEASDGQSQADQSGQQNEVEGDPQTGGPPITPPGQANEPNGGVGNGKGNGNVKHADGTAEGNAEIPENPNQP